MEEQQKRKVIYLIGSLRNLEIPKIANLLRNQQYEVFDDWYSPGPEADDYWRDYEKGRNSTYRLALKGYAARHIFEFDKEHLDRADIVVMVMPAGRSGHLELGYAIGREKEAYILFDHEPERFDVMHCFANEVFFSVEELIQHLKEKHDPVTLMEVE
jgi:nucleoside 2-deoxyribosyltransferase